MDYSLPVHGILQASVPYWIKHDIPSWASGTEEARQWLSTVGQNNQDKYEAKTEKLIIWLY